MSTKNERLAAQKQILDNMQREMRVMEIIDSLKDEFESFKEIEQGIMELLEYISMMAAVRNEDVFFGDGSGIAMIAGLRRAFSKLRDLEES